MMVKSGLEFFILISPSPFRVAAAQCQKIYPLGLNWPGRLAGISEAKNVKVHFNRMSPSWCGCP